MLFTLQEINQWLGVTAFEIGVWLSSFLIFSILLVIKVDGFGDLSWWSVFSPLFIGDSLNAYFIIIVSIRMFVGKKCRAGLLRAAWSLTALLLLFIFQLLLCWKLEHSSAFEYSEVMTPLFILAQLIMLRGCHYH